MSTPNLPSTDAMSGKYAEIGECGHSRNAIALLDERAGENRVGLLERRLLLEERKRVGHLVPGIDPIGDRRGSARACERREHDGADDGNEQREREQRAPPLSPLRPEAEPQHRHSVLYASPVATNVSRGSC